MSNIYYIDVSERYQAAFGSARVSEINTLSVESAPNKFNIEVFPKSAREFGKMTFTYGEKSLVFNDMLKGDTSSVFAPPLLLNFSREKNLTETMVKGSNNIVVERWGTSPWQIDIQGILIDVENRFYPSSQIEELNQFFEYNDVIEVVGEQFYDKNIDSIYIQSLSITAVEGYADTVQFNMSAMSQSAVNFSLLNPII